MRSGPEEQLVEKLALSWFPKTRPREEPPGLAGGQGWSWREVRLSADDPHRGVSPPTPQGRARLPPPAGLSVGVLGL